MRNKSGRKSLVRRMWFVMIVALLIFLAAFTTSTLIINSKSKHDYEAQESDTLINGIEDNIIAGFENYEDLSRLVMLNKQVILYLKSADVDPGLINDTKYAIMDVLNVCENVDSVYVFRNDSNYMSTGRGQYKIDIARMSTEEWRHSILDSRGGAVVFMNGNNAVFKSNEQPLITISRAIYDIHSQTNTGILMMNISTGILKKSITTRNEQMICITDIEGNYLAGNESLVEYFSKDFLTVFNVHKEVEIDNADAMISGKRISTLPLVVICKTSADLSAIPIDTMYAMIVLLVAAIAVISIAGLFIARNVAKPIMQLSKGIEKTKESGWMQRIDIKLPNNEIGALADSYNSIVDYLNDLFNKLIDQEKSVRKAEMRVLQEQIKPHFLYNSLATISSMAVIDGADDVRDALETLGAFYRNFLSKGDKEISVRREINIIQDYLSLQKLRYGDIIKDEYDIAPETLDIKIPKLILQPLVENSINHGIRMTGEGGIIRVSTYRENGSLIITVFDSGVGMTGEQIESILEPSDTKQMSEADIMSKSFGLKGTIDRIRYYCGYEDVATIRSELGEFTEIKLKLPALDEN